MKKLTRRSFIGTSAMGALAASTLTSCTTDQGPQTASALTNTAATGESFSHPVFFQSYGMRKEIEKDFQGTLIAVKELGYDGIEMCSPQGNHYKEAGFGNLTNLPPEEVQKMIADTGLICKSAHIQSHEVLQDDPAKTADYCAALGLEDMIMSGSGISDDGTLDEFKRWAEQCNRVAETVKAAGLRLGYHNHRVAPMLEDKPQYEHIMDLLDPDLITMQFQFASIRDGYDLAYYLEKYAGRYSSLHMHDYDPAMKHPRIPGRLGGIVPLGEGIVDWSACLKAAMMSNIADHGYIVEIETDEAFEGLRRSIAYLKTVAV